MIYFRSPTTHPKEAEKHCLEIKCVLNEMPYLPYIFWWGWSAWLLQIVGARVPSVHQSLLMWVWLQYHVCFSVILHGSQAPACINLPVSCGQVLISLVQSLFILSSQSISPCTFTLKRSFTSSLPLPAKNLWLLGFDFNHCRLKSPLWHPSMFSCCRAPYFIYLYSDPIGELWDLQNELIYPLRCEYRAYSEVNIIV